MLQAFNPLLQVPQNRKVLRKQCTGGTEAWDNDLLVADSALFNCHLASLLRGCQVTDVEFDSSSLDDIHPLLILLELAMAHQVQSIFLVFEEFHVVDAGYWVLDLV
mmetsp:Transcript_16847/g.16099  ORF Transcript_16847/g.16099 Transcript_16847/m.16099 type:complete len:106 (-) Transcript_16847:3042-3359(-)